MNGRGYGRLPCRLRSRTRPSVATSPPARPAYDQLRAQVEKGLELAENAVEQLYGGGGDRIRVEIQMAQTKLLAVRKSAKEQAVHEGLISPDGAE